MNLPEVPTSSASASSSGPLKGPRTHRADRVGTVDLSDEHRAQILARRGVADPGQPDSAVLVEQGLTTTQLQQRIDAGLTNAQPHDTSRSLGKILRVHVLTLFNLAIGVCAVLIVVMGRWLDLLFCLAALANVIIGVVQEYTAKRKLDRIALLNQDGVLVLRDGEPTEVAVAEVVLDDAVLLRRGDQIPTDGVVLQADGLDVDESLLTGEADAVGKRPGDAVLSGASVMSGSALYRATGVGADSHATRLTVQARKFVKVHSELREALEKVAKWITIGLIPMIAIIVNGQVQAVGGWAYVLAEELLEAPLVATVAGVTTMIPQGLALMTTISFALAALKLAQEKVLIQEQPAVEILARVDTVCLDKTGTLTEGGIVFGSATLLTEETEAETQWEQVLAWLGADSNANPTALALRERFTDLPGHATDQVAFTSERRWSAVGFGLPSTMSSHQTERSTPAKSAAFSHSSGSSILTVQSGLTGAWVLGAPEALLEHVDTSAENRERIQQLCEEPAGQGLRTMLLCRGLEPAPGSSAEQTDQADEIQEADESEQHVWFGRGADMPGRLSAVVMLTFRENVRDDAASTLQYFRDQGVQLKVISGDHPRTVAAVAREVGMQITGSAYDARFLPDDPQQLTEVLAEHSVFGRVTPDQKHDIVVALQSGGHVVAMTGDGINDALAVKTADLGIAMGNAAPATKAVSRLVLLDGKFSRLPSVLAEGRKVIANMERLAHLFLAKTSYALLFAVVFSLFFWQYPLLPRQASTADFLMIGLPSFFLAMMPNPRRYVSGFLARALRFAVPTGVAMLLGLIGINLYARIYAGNFSGVMPASAEAALTMNELQTASFITLTLMGLWVLNVTSRPLNRWKLLLIGSMYVLLVVVLIVPISLWYHQFDVPPTPVLLASVLIAAAACGLIELIHRIHHARLALAPEDPRPAA